jgi:predicted GNAT family acetyltransferase
MNIQHDIEKHKAWIDFDNQKAEVEYIVINGTLDVIHTFVPPSLEGQGIASQLVKFVYDYGLQQGLRPAATCTYAKVWLERHSVDYRVE